MAAKIVIVKRIPDDMISAEDSNEIFNSVTPGAFCALALAVAWMILKITLFTRMGRLVSAISYLSMGWLGAVLAVAAYGKLGILSLAIALIGGLCYTLGSIVFFSGRPNPFPPNFGSHEIWHLSVFAGNAAFYCVMLFFVLPFGKRGNEWGLQPIRVALRQARR